MTIGRFRTEGISTPSHIIPVDGKLFNRWTHNGTVFRIKFDSVLVKERDVRVVEKDVESRFFPDENVNQIPPSSQGRRKRTLGTPQPHP